MNVRDRMLNSSEYFFGVRKEKLGANVVDVER